MLHGTNSLRQGSATLVVLIGLLVTIITPATANALSRPTIDMTSNTVRLIENTDGTLTVISGSTFAAADLAGGRVVVEEQDVVMTTTLVDARDFLDQDGQVTDTYRADQWGLDLVQAETAWERSDGSGQVIAVIDSGVDGAHPDLRDRLVPGYSAIGADELVDGHGHGTHVAGTAAASIGEEYGVAGLAHQASIMPIQVTDPQGLAYASDVARGLIWAADHGATVANLSLAGTQRSQVLDAAIDYAVNSDMVVVVAAGNEFKRNNPITFPAAHPRVLAVGALRDAETRSSFSSTGSFVDLAAPGSSILSDRPGRSFGYASGTSMSSPLVAGAAALLRSLDPDLTATEVGDALTSTATDVGAAGRDDEFGHGVINLLAAMDAVAGPAAEAAPRPGVDTDNQFDESDAQGVVNPLPIDPITQRVEDGSWVSMGWGF